MKKILAMVFLALALVVFSSTLTLAETDSPTQAAESSHVLVAYFSRVGNTEFPDTMDALSSASIIVDERESIVGNAEFMAEYIAQATGADLFPIETVDKYPIGYDETADIASHELTDSARPELAGTLPDFAQYETVFIGYPIWWGDMPMAVYSFIETADLADKTVIPFVTSGGSGFSSTQRTLAELLPDSNILEGLHLEGSNVLEYSAAEINGWLADIGIG